MVGEPPRRRPFQSSASSWMALEPLSLLASQGASEVQMTLAVDEMLFRLTLGHPDPAWFWQRAEALQAVVDAIALNTPRDVSLAAAGAGRGDVDRQRLGLRVVRDRIAAVIAG